MRTRQHHITSHCPEETVRIGALLGQHLAKGSVVALSGDLGSGKTCLTQGIARGLQVPEDFYVTSPSYSLVNDYPGRLRLFHVDLYRLERATELEEIGLDEILEADSVTVIEWADKLVGVLPRERLDLRLSIVDDSTRELHLTAYGQSAVDLVEECSKYTENK